MKITRLRYTSLLFGFCLLFSFTARAQEYRADFIDGNLLMEENFYNKALTTWHLINNDFPDIPNINYKLGVSYLNSSYDRSQALPFLEIAARDIAKNYDPFNPAEKKSPSEVLFYLGQANHLNYKLDEAIASYNQFLGAVHPKHDLAAEARRQVEICETAKILIADSLNIGINNMGKILNSEEGDFSPVISVDEGAIFFTSRRTRKDSLNAYTFSDLDGKHFEDIYVSYKDENGNWLPPELLDFSTINSHEATINVSADGQTLFIYMDSEGNGDIFKSTQIGDIWTNPEPLGSDINTKYWETHVTMSADGNTLYFVSDRKGGQGGRDIYRCVRLPNGEWSKALNVGAPINTEYDEDAPFLHPDGKTMYFASRGHNTMGGFDIFKTELSPEGKWSDPTNIGYPINTVDDDVFFVTSADGQRAYYTSFRAGGYGEKDLYVLEMNSGDDGPCLAVLKGRIYTDGSPIPETTTIYLTDISTGANTLYRPRSRDGVFVAIVEPGGEYIIEYTIDDSTVLSDQFVVPSNSCYIEVDKALRLKPLVIGSDTILTLDSIPTKPTGPGDQIARTLKWQLRYKDLPYDKQGVVVTYLDENGMIKFTEKVGSKGMFEYHEIPGVQEYIFGVESEERECDDMSIVLVDENGKRIGDSQYLGECKLIWRADGWEVAGGDITVAPADYQRYYKYNKLGVDEERKWEDFINQVAKIIEVKGGVNVTIEGSASKVPTRTFKTNENLSQKRSEAAKGKLMRALEARDIDPSVVKFIAVNSLVQGPAYSTGNIRPVAEYERYQYIKISAALPE